MLKRIIYLKLKKYGILADRKEWTLKRILVTACIGVFLIVAGINLIEHEERIDFYEPLVITVPVEEISMEPVEVSATVKGVELANYCNPIEY